MYTYILSIRDVFFFNLVITPTGEGSRGGLSGRIIDTRFYANRILGDAKLRGEEFRAIEKTQRKYRYPSRSILLF